MPGRGTLEKEKPPIFGMVQRGGAIILHLLANVRQATIKPLLLAGVALGSLINTDEYAIYGRLPEWGFGHKTVNHGRGEYARDEDGDGFCEVHVNTMEGVWSLLRSWLRPHRGISQEKLPAYLAFFQVVHNARRRGKALLGALVASLVA
jgi:transposase-like protein